MMDIHQLDALIDGVRSTYHTSDSWLLKVSPERYEQIKRLVWCAPLYLHAPRKLRKCHTRTIYRRLRRARKRYSG